jgi:hypothetical protein
LPSGHTAGGDTCWRWVGPAEAVVVATVAAALRLAARLDGRDGKAWLLERHDLAPNHWFNGG